MSKNTELTFVAEARLVFLEASEPDALAQQVKELIEGGAALLVIVHVLLCLLACSAVHHSHLKYRVIINNYQRVSVL